MKKISWTKIDNIEFYQIAPHFIVIKGAERYCVAVGEGIENDAERLKALGFLININPQSMTTGAAFLFAHEFDVARGAGGYCQEFDEYGAENKDEFIYENALNHIALLLVRDIEKSVKLSEPKLREVLKPYVWPDWLKHVNRALYLRTHNFAGSLPNSKDELMSLAKRILTIDTLSSKQKGAIRIAFKTTC